MGKYPDSGSEAHISFISRIQVRARMADQTPVEGEEGTMPRTYDAATGLTESADQKVNIAPSDTKIEMGKEKEKEEEGFKGLSKEELMQFANDPFWVRLRWTLFVLFWIVWVAMLVASVVIIIYAPKCPSPEAKQWWQKGPVYKSPVETFPDGNGAQAVPLKCRSPRAWPGQNLQLRAQVLIDEIGTLNRYTLLDAIFSHVFYSS